MDILRFPEETDPLLAVTGAVTAGSLLPGPIVWASPARTRFARGCAPGEPEAKDVLLPDLDGTLKSPLGKL